jgi:plasmid stabilization system protein ParE
MFRVRWKKTARNDLASLWTEADSAMRQAITEAAHRIDQLLARTPEEQGESRPGNSRIFFVAPLGVRFRILPEQATVWVMRIWLF